MDNQTKSLLAGFIIGVLFGTTMCWGIMKSLYMHSEKKMFESACGQALVFHHDQYKNMAMCSDGRAFSLSVSTTQTSGVK